jgi:hypothetical protein
MFEALEDCGRRQDLHPGGGKLDREREAVDTAADLAVLTVRRQVLGHSPSTLSEQRDGLRLAKRIDSVLPLATDMQRLATRHQNVEPWAAT